MPLSFVQRLRHSPASRALAIVAAMYLVKLIAELYVGFEYHSPMLAGDGFHHVTDLCAVIVMAIALGAPSAAPSLEKWMSAAMGWGLVVLAVYVALTSGLGLLSYAPSADAAVRDLLPLPAHEPLRMGRAHLFWAIGVTAPGAVLALIVGKYEERVGRETGHPLLIADGKDTVLDGHVELLALIGIILDYAVGAAWPEYCLGFYVAYKMIGTAREILSDSRSSPS
jgi:divalent metal cation (Fe/Co/Zn/Cd) transporter